MTNYSIPLKKSSFFNIDNKQSHCFSSEMKLFLFFAFTRGHYKAAVSEVQRDGGGVGGPTAGQSNEAGGRTRAVFPCLNKQPRGRLEFGVSEKWMGYGGFGGDGTIRGNSRITAGAFFFFTRHHSASEPIRAVGFVGPCNDIFGQTQLEMKGGRREGVLGS